MTICIPSQLAVGRLTAELIWIGGVVWIAAPPLGPVPVGAAATVDVPVWWGFLDPAAECCRQHNSDDEHEREDHARIPDQGRAVDRVRELRLGGRLGLRRLGLGRLAAREPRRAAARADSSSQSPDQRCFGPLISGTGR